MGSYIENTLIKDEKIIAKAQLSVWSMLPKILLAIVLFAIFLEQGFLPAIVIALIVLIPLYLGFISTELAFTNKRVVAKFGFIRRKTIELNIGKIESIQVNQSFLGRIFNFGTLVISGAGNPQAPIPGIADPMQFRQAFMQHQDQPHD